MRQIYLIARREYLSYVATVGFWLSLALVPVFMAAGVFVPVLIERAAPTRYYTVISNDPTLEAAFEDRLAEAERRRLRAGVEALARIAGDDADAALDAFDAAPDAEAALAAALDEIGAEAATADMARTPDSKFVRVDAPADDPDALRPYLLGQAMVETPDGPQVLFAAIFLRRDADGGVSVDYWSAQLTNFEIKDTAERAMRDLLRREALAGLGVDAGTLARADRLRPELREFTPEREAGAAEVTLADRAPHFIGMFLGIGLWVVIFSVVNMLLTSTIEEKSNKVLETLLASARLTDILIAKLLGVAAVSFTLLGAWGGAGLLAAVASTRLGGGLPPEILSAVLDPGLLIPFAGYFVAGYLMYGAIFLSIGSLCETIQEAQTLMSPMIFVLMVPMFLLPLGVRDPDSAIIGVLSWVPLYTPFLMLLRLPTDPPLFDVLATTALLIATTLGVLWAAGGVFRAGVVGRAGPGALKALLGRGFARLTSRGRA